MSKIKLAPHQKYTLANLIIDSIELGEIDVHEYVGYTDKCENKPLEVIISGEVVLTLEVVMNVRDNGEYDGVEGYNY